MEFQSSRKSYRKGSIKALMDEKLLRQAAEAAARQAKFSPTLLGGKAVKISGVIVYNFVPE
ncbi:MAG: hypothetical protein LC768_14495 [Acidobacteria bacterium]|nr:hypothetical protein [Acidobacteriota bacterium]MCA1639518.1 hypothetical protein [Acidobacteriota bacterium]